MIQSRLRKAGRAGPTEGNSGGSHERSSNGIRVFVKAASTPQWLFGAKRVFSTTVRGSCLQDPFVHIYCSLMNRASATWQWDDVRFFLGGARRQPVGCCPRAGRRPCDGRKADYSARETPRRDPEPYRTPDGIATTSAGYAVLRQCIAMENAALDIERLAAGRDWLVTGSVRVTLTEALAFQVVAPAVASLRQAHPGLQVDLTVGVRSLDIARRDADLAVRFARPSTSDLVCRKLGEVGYSLYASERVSAKIGDPKARPGVGRLRFGHLHRCAAGDEPILHGRASFRWRTHSPAVRQSPHPVEGRGQRRGYCRTHVLPRCIPSLISFGSGRTKRRHAALRG